MTMWGFTPDYFELSEKRFIDFLNKNVDVPKAEFPIPPCIEPLVQDGEVTVKVLDTDSRWFGVTYSADRPGVVEKFAELHANGEYPVSNLGACMFVLFVVLFIVMILVAHNYFVFENNIQKLGQRMLKPACSQKL